jgi:hypothetical protein
MGACGTVILLADTSSTCSAALSTHL